MALSNMLMNWALYVDGIRKVGSGESCALPSLKRKGEDIRGGGMIAPVEAFFGHDKLTAKFKMNTLDADVIRLLVIGDVETAFTFRGSLYNGTRRIPVRARMLGVLSEGSFGDWKMGGVISNDYTIAISRYTLQHGDTRLIHMDPIAGILEVDGEDQYAEDRASLGF